MHKNVWILTLAQMFMMSMNSLHVLVGGLVGDRIASSEKLATLPVASIMVGTAMATIPVTMLMKKIGRKKTFLIVSGYSILVSLFAAYAIAIESFYLFVFCAFLMGVSNASMMQFRFASMESVKSSLIPKAASVVLIGGIVAAFIGPEVAVFGKDIFDSEFTGSYVLLAGLFAVGFVILTFYQNTTIKESIIDSPQRSFGEIAKQPVFWTALLAAAVGYAVMSFIMTATPVSMHVMDGHSLSDTKWVIQTHIVAMFLPSIFTGELMKRFGIHRVMIMGLVAYIFCIVIAFSGHLVYNYWISLILLGVGWNFLFLAGTVLLPQAYTASERFKVQAINEFIVFGTQAIVALSAGWVVFALGWENLLLLTLPIIAIQFVMIWIWRKSNAKLNAN
ncbi:MAG: MFS family permease [Cyclobacteriaceae bacterium]|jgi:MFS family permease